ncbi:hypothetical protein GAGA_2770 [Paraglaciecola agarilytica NO2]|uniref:Uncharacterized protein n=1 Tax=Paraglaciecola agarilytica NO2 TaxID=1125747 RepID=A0ABQ0I968_9ALTE|nr:hypothetical protein GAGA_2770 [Paraglaciecola agarilytica NO2]
MKKFRPRLYSFKASPLHSAIRSPLKSNSRFDVSNTNPH